MSKSADRILTQMTGVAEEVGQILKKEETIMGRWSSEHLKSISDRYDRMLRLSSYPVAVKLFEDPKELDEVKDEGGRPVKKLAGKKLTICQVLAQARYLGKVMAVTDDNLRCIPARAALGFIELPLEYADGYVRAYFTDEEVARRTLATIPRFKAGKYAAILVSPLERMPVDPDVVVFFGNTAQMQRFIHGYLYNKGGRLEFSSNGEAVCADVIVPPMQTGKGFYPPELRHPEKK